MTESFSGFQLPQTTSSAIDTRPITAAPGWRPSSSRTSSENVFSRSGCRNARSPTGSGSWPRTWGICFRTRIVPIAASRPLITLDGKNAATNPARATPKAIWIRPATTTAIWNAWKDPSEAIWAVTIAVNPAAGPLTLVCDPLSIPTRTPPTIPARTPESSGAWDASATPRHNGRATSVPSTFV
jgi:hypothetical protein